MRRRPCNFVTCDEYWLLIGLFCLVTLSIPFSQLSCLVAEISVSGDNTTSIPFVINYTSLTGVIVSHYIQISTEARATTFGAGDKLQLGRFSFRT
jgi:hypothetical protein